MRAIISLAPSTVALPRYILVPSTYGLNLIDAVVPSENDPPYFMPASVVPPMPKDSVKRLKDSENVSLPLFLLMPNSTPISMEPPSVMSTALEILATVRPARHDPASKWNFIIISPKMAGQFQKTQPNALIWCASNSNAFAFYKMIMPYFNRLQSVFTVMLQPCITIYAFPPVLLAR